MASTLTAWSVPSLPIPDTAASPPFHFADQTLIVDVPPLLSPYHTLASLAQQSAAPLQLDKSSHLEGRDDGHLRLLLDPPFLSHLPPSCSFYYGCGNSNNHAIRRGPGQHGPSLHRHASNPAKRLCRRQRYQNQAVALAKVGAFAVIISRKAVPSSLRSAIALDPTSSRLQHRQRSLGHRSRLQHLGRPLRRRFASALSSTIHRFATEIAGSSRCALAARALGLAHAPLGSQKVFRAQEQSDA